jgi:CRP/FNR family cyclic AMP-dependent transcriptional regulator
VASTALAQSSQSELAELVAAAFGCDGALAAAICGDARVRRFASHAVILDAEPSQQDVHLLADGQARLVADSLEGRLVVIEDYGVGEVIGLTGLFGWDGVPAQVVSVGSSRTGAFAGHIFVKLMNAHAAIALAISRMLVTRLASANRRVAENATLSAPGRIHAEILRRARGAEGMTIRPMPVFSELALSLQTTRESVSRAVSALEKRGIVKRVEGGLAIVAPHRLEELVY